MKHRLLVASLSALAAASPDPSRRVFDRSSAFFEFTAPGREDCNGNGIPDDMETVVAFTHHDASYPPNGRFGVVTRICLPPGPPDRTK